MKKETYSWKEIFKGLKKAMDDEDTELYQEYKNKGKAKLRRILGGK